jgi:undecaprenyl pyrophosphate phosphatase UppP
MRVAFLVGAVTDGLAIIPMLSRRVGAALFGGDPTRDSPAYRFAMGIAASLMTGWTLLLLWAALEPIGRRGVLLLTVFPVITGIVAATVIAIRHNIVARARVQPPWIHLAAVSTAYLLLFVVSTPYAH